MTQSTRTPQWNFSASASTPGVTALVPASMRIPTVLYTPEVWAIIQLAVAECEKEVGWLGLVQEMDNGDYLIDKVFIPEQQVTGAETDIDSHAMAALANEILDLGEDPGRLIYWGHSHVNMGVTPSAQDEKQIEAYLTDQPVMIRGIYNKKGAAKVDIFDRNRGVVFQCVPNQIVGLPPEVEAQWKQVIKTNVKAQVYTPPPSWTWAPPAVADSATSLQLAIAEAGNRQVHATNGHTVFIRDVLSYDKHTGQYRFPQNRIVDESTLTMEEDGLLYAIADERYLASVDWESFDTIG